MPKIISEQSFEDEVGQVLIDNGWIHKPDNQSSGYDKRLALYPQDIVAWLQASGQLEDADPREVAEAVSRQIAEVGVIATLRQGVSFRGQQLKLAQFRPTNNLNPQLSKNYKANILRFERQLRYSESSGNCIDVVAFLNGVPIWTAELKSSFKQSAEDAIEQYRRDRHPAGEPLLEYTPVHIAASSTEIFTTTKLSGPETDFQPFVNPDEDSSIYFWKILGRPRETLNLYENFFFRGFFPRFNQWQAITEVIKDFKYSDDSIPGGKRYLLDHSPGAGKTMTIACLSHQLAFLHDDTGKNLVDLVVVVTNRRVLDQQAGQAVVDAEKVSGVVAVIDGRGGSKSKQFQQAVASGARVVVVTLPTFMHLEDDPKFKKLMRSKKCVVVIDEAHAGQSGAMSQEMQDVLSGASGSAEDYFNRKLQADKDNPTTYVAFTATPKKETLQIFGRQGQPFHSYSMRQAEEEGMIMPVLDRVIFLSGGGLLTVNGQKYAYESLDRDRGERAVRKWVDSQERVLADKLIRFMAEFMEQCADDINGQSKAMATCSSRLEAGRMKRIYDQLAPEYGWPKQSLVAFTGVIDIDGREYSEADMNGFTGDVDTRFARDGYRILFVADKYQVGFDEPRLSGLLVNKNLSEPSSLVQTYSRVNRTTPGKTKTIIVDFVNSPEEVYDAFAIYRQGTNLQQETITLEELDRDIEKIQVIRQEDISSFSALCQSGSAPQHSDLASIFHPIAVRYRNLLQHENISEAEEISLREFPRLLRQRVRVYHLQKQTAGFEDSADQDIISLFYDYLGQILKAQRDQPEPIVLDEKISLESYNIFFSDQSTGDQGGAGEQKAPLNGGESKPRKTYLQDLLSALNRQYSDDPEYEFWVRQLISEVSDDPVIIEQAVANSRQTFIGSPELKRSISNAVVSISGQVDVYKNYLQAMDGKEIPIIAGAVYDQLSGDVLGQLEQS